jgi:plastocyanin
MRISPLPLVLISAAACAGGSATGPSQSQSVHNPIEASASLQFSPKEITIAVGDSVTFVISSVEHSVEFQKGEELKAYYGGASSSGAPDNVGVSANTKAVRVFATPGSFRYRCTIHAAMQGEVTVQ